MPACNVRDTHRFTYIVTHVAADTICQHRRFVHTLGVFDKLFCCELGSSYTFTLPIHLAHLSYSFPTQSSPLVFHQPKNIFLTSTMDIAIYRRFIEIADGSKNDLPQNLPVRSAKGNTQGRETTVQLNFFNVQQVPMKKVYQYDVTMLRPHGQVDEKQRNFMRKIWGSKALQNKIGKGWLYDNGKLAW
jgi:hypothetical protein